MELKNIFKMTKTDRYTQDGRDELAKLQETEDVKYKPGDISQKTGLQKQPDGSWAPPKHGAKSTAKQEYKEKDRTARTIHNEMQNTKRPTKTITTHIDNGFYDEEIRKAAGNKEQLQKIAEKAMSPAYEGTGEKVPQEFIKYGAEKLQERYNKMEAAAKRKPAAAPKLNQVEKVDNTNRPYRIKGTQFYFETPEEAETAIVAGTRGEGKTYAKPSSDATINEIQNALGFKLDSEYAGKYSMDDFIKKTGKDEYGVRVWSFGTDSKGTLIDTIVEGYNKPNATIKKENGEWRLHYTDRDGKKMIVTPKGREWPTSDSAPRQLTGDCRIRIRPETQDKVYQIGDISQKTGLQKQPDGSWAPPKKGARAGAGKQAGAAVSRAQKEEAIRKDLDLRGEHDLDRFSDEQIEMMYQKSQRTPEQQKADFDNSKLGQAYNKARKEYDDHQAAYKNRQRMRDAEKEIGVAESLERMYESRGRDSEAAAAREYRNAAENLKALTGQVENLPRNREPDKELQQKIQEAQKKLDEARVKARPGQSKPAADFTKYKRDTGLNLHGKSAEEGEQYMKENGFELVRNDPDYKVYKNEYGEEYDAFYTQAGVFNGGSHTKAPIPNIQNHKDYQKGLGNKYLGQKKFEDGTITQVYLTPEGKYETSHFTTKGEYNGGSTSSKEFYDKWYGDWKLEDSAPRILTGDTKIRIRK